MLLVHIHTVMKLSFSQPIRFDKSVMDNKANVFQFVRHQESELEFEDEVGGSLSSF